MRLFFAVLALVIAGCQSHYSDAIIYQCGDKAVTLSVVNDQSAVLVVDKASFELTRVYSVSGEKWQARELVFWTKGSEAMMLKRGIKTLSCTLSQQASN